jgi:hypothetical protein
VHYESFISLGYALYGWLGPRLWVASLWGFAKHKSASDRRLLRDW